MIKKNVHGGYYSQNNEDVLIYSFLEKYDILDNFCTMLSIGENDGITLSNSRLLIEHEVLFKAFLIEPDPVSFTKLQGLYNDSNLVELLNVAVGEELGQAKFFVSGSLLNQGDSSLVSTMKEETVRWKNAGIEFTETIVPVVDFNWINKKWNEEGVGFSIISIDAEGMDWEILRQINLSETMTLGVMIECNSNKEIEEKVIGHCASFGLTYITRCGAENLFITCKPL